jgi:hypothetical protein
MSFYVLVRSKYTPSDVITEIMRNADKNIILKCRGDGISWALASPSQKVVRRPLEPFGVALASVVVRWMTRRGRRTPYRAREGGEQAGSLRRRWPREGRRSAPERKEEKERT